MPEIFSNFEDLKLLHLSENMRLRSLTKDPTADEDALNYPDYLLEVGEGKLKQDNRSETDLTPWINAVKSSRELVHSILRIFRTSTQTRTGSLLQQY